MPTDKRRLREVLDADDPTLGSGVNDSKALNIAQIFTRAYRDNMGTILGQNLSGPFNPSFPTGGTQAAWLAMWAMGDREPVVQPTPVPYQVPNSANNFLGNHPNKSGVVGAGSSFNPANGAYGGISSLPLNSGLKHYAHQVQFGKGASSLNGSVGGNFLQGGGDRGFGNLNALPPASNQENNYATQDIRMSDFYGVHKTATSNNYVMGDGNDEIMLTGGPISIGDAAPDPNLGI